MSGGPIGSRPGGHAVAVARAIPLEGAGIPGLPEAGAALAGPSASRGERMKRLLKWALFVVGVVAVGLLVRRVGAAEVGRVLLAAGPWFPAIVLFEVALAASEAVGMRLMLAERGAQVPLGAWIRATASCYAFSILAPAGRAAGEVARAAVLSRSVGASAAAAAGGQAQGVTLVANAIISVVGFVFAASLVGFAGTLPLLLLANVAVTGVGGAVVLYVARLPKVTSWFARQLDRFGFGGGDVEAATRIPKRRVAMAVASGVLGRAAQIGQYAVLLVAVGGSLSATGAVVAHGLHMVSASVGDMVPNQMGVTEGMYTAFAGTLGFEGALERALSIPLLARIAQIMLAGICVLVGATGRETGPAR